MIIFKLFVLSFIDSLHEIFVMISEVLMAYAEAIFLDADFCGDELVRDVLYFIEAHIFHKFLMH